MNQLATRVAKTLALLAILLLQAQQVLAADCCCVRPSGGIVTGSRIGGPGELPSSCCRSSSSQPPCKREGKSGPCQCPPRCCTADTAPACESDQSESSDGESSTRFVTVLSIDAVDPQVASFCPEAPSSSYGLQRSILLCCLRL